MTPENERAAQNATHQPALIQVLTWTAIATALALLGYLGAWPWLGAVPIAWLAWIIGRRLAGIGPER